MEFSVKGIKFKVSYLFLSAVTIFIATDKTGIYIPLFFFILAHEFAHIITLFYFGGKIRCVKLIIGTIGIVYDENITKFEKIVSLLSGPLINLFLGLIFVLFKDEKYFCINFVLFAFNILPLKGLDGGSIFAESLSGFLSKKTIDFILFTNAIIFTLIVVSFIFHVSKYSYSNYSIILFLFYLFTPLIVKKFVER